MRKWCLSVDLEDRSEHGRHTSSGDGDLCILLAVAPLNKLISTLGSSLDGKYAHWGELLDLGIGLAVHSYTTLLVVILDDKTAVRVVAAGDVLLEVACADTESRSERVQNSCSLDALQLEDNVLCVGIRAKLNLYKSLVVERVNTILQVVLDSGHKAVAYTPSVSTGKLYVGHLWNREVAVRQIVYLYIAVELVGITGGDIRGAEHVAEDDDTAALMLTESRIPLQVPVKDIVEWSGVVSVGRSLDSLTRNEVAVSLIDKSGLDVLCNKSVETS